LRNPDLPEMLWSQLDGRLWHATSRDRLKSIIADKEIRVAVGDRYTGSFCRDNGAVCLFDFGQNSIEFPGQSHNWLGWFGHQQNARYSVWLEIDRALVLESLQDATATHAAWRAVIDRGNVEDETDPPKTMIIPGVEACHRGPIPIKAISGVLLIDRYDQDQIQLIGKPGRNTFRDIDVFEAKLPPHDDNPLVAALLSGRNQKNV